MQFQQTVNDNRSDAHPGTLDVDSAGGHCRRRCLPLPGETDRYRSRHARTAGEPCNTQTVRSSASVRPPGTGSDTGASRCGSQTAAPRNSCPARGGIATFSATPPMKTEFRKAEVPQELRSLLAFDRKVFSASDVFPASYWKTCEAWWLLIDGVKAGCCAFQKNVDFREDIEQDNWNPVRKGSLYIATTGLLPRYQGQGFGPLLKAWQIAWARRHGFSRIITNTRGRNQRMIDLNTKFGFTILRTTPGYYAGPSDSTVVMELVLPKLPKKRAAASPAKSRSSRKNC